MDIVVRGYDRGFDWKEWQGYWRMKWLSEIEKNCCLLWPKLKLALNLQISALALYLASFLVHIGAIRGAYKLHNDLLAGIIRAPQSFFDTSPLGRIISRFSGDVDTLDSRMAQFIRSALITSHRVIKESLCCWYRIEVIKWHTYKVL